MKAKPICPACGYEVDRLIHVLGCKYASHKSQTHAVDCDMGFDCMCGVVGDPEREEEVLCGASGESEVGEAGGPDPRQGADATGGAGARVRPALQIAR
jgi:hypothetical protein